MDKAKRVALCRELGLADEAGDDAILIAVGSLKTDKATALNRAETPSLEKFVPRADHDKIKADLATALNTIETDRKSKLDAEITSAVDAAVAAGKVTPATKDYYVASCRESGGLERFKQFVAAAPSLTGTSGLDSKQAGAETANGALTAEEKALCTRMGLTEDAFKAAKAA
jgi:phage I-like protein